MKILLIHPTFSPTSGCAESLMKAEAEGFAKLGHTVSVLTGSAGAESEWFTVYSHEELHPSYPLNLQTKRAVDHGQTDHHFHEFSNQLKALIEPYAQEHDAIISHGILTTHFNLALTQALWEIAATKPTAEWALDLTATNSDYSLPNPDQMPWALMRQAHPNVTYFAPSQNRKQELIATLGLSEFRVMEIPYPTHLPHLFGLHPDLSMWLEGKEILKRDIVLYYPAKLLPRKGIDRAMDMVLAIKNAGISVALLISGSPDVYGPAPSPYEGYIDSIIGAKKLTEDVFILNRFQEWNDSMWRQMFLVADALLFPSKCEGVSLPIVEASMYRLPIWCKDIPVNAELGVPSTAIESPSSAVDAAQNLLASPDCIARKYRIRECDYLKICEEKILPAISAASS